MFDYKSLFSEYRITKEIGRGGFGRVMLGVHKCTNKKVALKFVDPKGFGDASNIASVYTEAESASKIHHKNIIKIQSTFMMRKYMCFIMEYCEGGELLDLVKRRGRLRENEAKEIFLQMVSGMDACHKENLIHRDLKLENILLLHRNKLEIRVNFEHQ